MLSHVVFWMVFLRHLPFFRLPLSFLDFDTYLLQWREVLAGISPYTVSHMFTLGPPIALLPYLPFVFLPQVLSQFVFFVINLYCGYALCQKISLRFWPTLTGWLFLSLLLFVSFPVRFSLLMGQPALIVAYLVTEVLLSRKKTLPLFFLVMLKTFFVWILVAFIKHKKIKVITVLFCVAATIFAFSPLLPSAWYTQYFRGPFTSAVVSSPGRAGTDYYNQSLKSTFHRFGGDKFYLPLWIFLVVSLGLICWRTQSLSLAVVSSLYLSPVVWQHYLVFILPILAIAFFSSVKPRERMMLLLAGILCSVNLPGFHEAKLNLLTAIGASHMFFGLTLLLVIEIQRPLARLKENLS